MLNLPYLNDCDRPHVPLMKCQLLAVSGPWFHVISGGSNVRFREKQTFRFWFLN